MIAPPVPSLPARARTTTAGPRPTRAIELGITCAVHAVAAAVAALAFSWQNPGTTSPRQPPRPQLFPLKDPDQHRKQPKVGSTAAATPMPVMPRPAAVQAPVPSLPPNMAEAQSTPSPAEAGGQQTDPAQEALAYRRALMARLEAQRLFPGEARHKSWRGAGSVQFRVERSGRLLETRVIVGTGRAALDAAVLDMIRRAEPFPAIPETMPDEMTITLPVEVLIDGPAMAVAP